MNDVLKDAAMAFRLAANDFKAKYAGSAFGSLWAVAEPAVTVLVYWFVYTVAFGGNAINNIPYYLWLSVGILPWFFVSGGINSVTMCFRDYSYLVKKMRFKKEILPTVRALSALISHLIFMIIVFFMCVFAGADLSRFYLLPIFCTAAFVLVFSIGKILSFLCARVKDVGTAVGVIMNILFWVTPVFWNEASVPEKFSAFITYNPAAIIVKGYRAVFLNTAMPNLKETVYFILLCLILFFISVLCEKKLLPDTADSL